MSVLLILTSVTFLRQQLPSHTTDEETEALRRRVNGQSGRGVFQSLVHGSPSPDLSGTQPTLGSCCWPPAGASGFLILRGVSDTQYVLFPLPLEVESIRDPRGSLWFRTQDLKPWSLSWATVTVWSVTWADN